MWCKKYHTGNLRVCTCQMHEGEPGTSEMEEFQEERQSALCCALRAITSERGLLLQAWISSIADKMDIALSATTAQTVL